LTDAGGHALGARPQGGDRCAFRVWAPRVKQLEVRLEGAATGRIEGLRPTERGYHEALLDAVPVGSSYRYRLDGAVERPDPASRYQPEGVHGPSQVVDTSFAWTDSGWRGLALDQYVTYELHVGTFTPQGSFAGVVEELDRLRALGVTAIELMPVAQFPGARNWGYDGACPFAVQNSYGGPRGLQALVDACHARGLAVVLDVVYNHLGPEGNYLAAFGPYFTDAYHTPWGSALNFDGRDSDEVRRYFSENALMWLEEFHVDALRLDAVHAILDHSARPFLMELAEAVDRRAQARGRRMHLIAESSSNDARLTRSRAEGGLGLHAQWSDDFHHSLHTLLTGEHLGYYQDYGRLADLEKAFREGFVLSGQRSAFRGRRHGSSSVPIPAERLVVCAQNHDQVGNRMLGERLTTLVDADRVRLAAAAVLLSPFPPLLFMGEEYGETAPFLYFVSHSDPALIEDVRQGRLEEFEAFAGKDVPPAPEAEQTFLRSRLDLDLIGREPHRRVAAYYAELLRLRGDWPALRTLSKECTEVRASESEATLWIRRWAGSQEALLALHFGGAPVGAPLPSGRWKTELDSGDRRWGGSGSTLPEELDSDGGLLVSLAPWCAALFRRLDHAGSSR